jgi:hypothetical protein
MRAGGLGFRKEINLVPLPAFASGMIRILTTSVLNYWIPCLRLEIGVFCLKFHKLIHSEVSQINSQFDEFDKSLLLVLSW